MDTIQKDFERKINRRIRRNNNRKKKEHQKDPGRILRGKEIMRKIIEQEENVEFRIQARVEVVDMANLAIGLERAGENKYLRSLSLLTQAAFKLAVDSLMDREEQIEDVEEAIDILERMRIIDIESSSLSGGALKRNRTRTALREFQRELRGSPREPKITDQEIEETRQKEKLARVGIEKYKKENNVEYLTPEEENRIAGEYFKFIGLDDVASQHKEQSSSLGKTTPEQVSRMNEYAMRMDLPGLHPNRTNKEPDFVLGETQEEKMERFRKSSGERLEDQYGE